MNSPLNLKRGLAAVMTCLLSGLAPLSAQSTNTEIDLSGSWHGHMTGNSLQGPELDQWETGFTMQLHDVRFEANNPLPDNPSSYTMQALAVVHYHECVWSPPPGTNCNTTINLDQRTLVGRIDGGGRSDLQKITPKFKEVEPDGTSTIICPDGSVTHSLFNNLSLSELIPSAHSPYDIYWEASDDGNTLYLERFVEDIVLGVHKKTWEIEGVLHRVKDETDTFPGDIPPGEMISTDEHTRKKVEISDVAEVTASPDSKFAIESEAAEEKTSIEHLKGELQHKVRQLGPDESYEIQAPQAVAGVRGTTFLTIVDQSRTLIGVSEGSVEVFTRDGSESLTLGEKEMVVIEDGEFPETTMDFTDFNMTFPPQNWWESQNWEKLNEWVDCKALGWMYSGHDPYVYSQILGYLYMPGQTPETGLFSYSFENSAWIWTSDNFAPWYWNYNTQEWSRAEPHESS